MIIEGESKLHAGAVGDSATKNLASSMPQQGERVPAIAPALPPGGSSHWDESARQMAEYIKANGHCDVSRHDNQYPGLRRWVVLQRLHARLGTLDAARKERLDQIGFDWVGPVESGGGEPGSGVPHEQSRKRERKADPASWNERFEQLRAFKEEKGHTRVPFGDGSGRTLMFWMSKQRLLRRQNTLDPEHVRRLNEIGFEWSPRRGRPASRGLPL